MFLLNFSHPITEAQRAQIEALSGQKIAEIRDVATHFDHIEAFSEQIRALVEEIGLTSQDWQSRSILLNPPAYNFAALTLLAELHGRMGYFPAIIRVRPVETPGVVGAPPHFEIAEIINLQAVREAARQRRF